MTLSNMVIEAIARTTPWRGWQWMTLIWVACLAMVTIRWWGWWDAAGMIIPITISALGLPSVVFARIARGDSLAALVTRLVVTPLLVVAELLLPWGWWAFRFRIS